MHDISLLDHPGCVFVYSTEELSGSGTASYQLQQEILTIYPCYNPPPPLNLFLFYAIKGGVYKRTDLIFNSSGFKGWLLTAGTDVSWPAILGLLHTTRVGWRRTFQTWSHCLLYYLFLFDCRILDIPGIWDCGSRVRRRLSSHFLQSHIHHVSAWLSCFFVILVKSCSHPHHNECWSWTHSSG